MQARHPLIQTILYAGLFVSASSSAQFRADPDLKGSGLGGNYGTYAPRGDCTREPRITVDDSGFTFRYGQHATRPPAVASAGGYFGRQDTLLAFFPFPTGIKRGESGLEAADPGPVLIALDTQANTLTLSASNPGVQLTPLQKVLIKQSPYARCGASAVASHAGGLPAAAATAAAYPQKLGFGAAAPKPTPAQAAAILHAAASDIRDFNHPEHPDYALALADLNDDGRTDLLVQYADGAFCGSSGCSGVIVMAEPDGYSRTATGLPNFYGRIDVLADKHHGMHDLRFDDGPVWTWNGKDYSFAKGAAAAPSAPARPSRTDTSAASSGRQAWQTREAAGRTLAMVVATDSVIKTISVFCDQGKPVLAMLVKARPPAGAVMLTFDFRGYPVVVPMGQGNREGTLWLSDLSRSDLPVWFTHRGSDASKEAFARIASEASLQINGGTQGRISLANSTATTRAALSGCYRY